MDYPIEIKQIVDYPRCRIYRNFLRDLIILDFLQERHYITYSKLARGNLIKFTISDWKNNNTWLEYNYPCTKDMGFFFFPVSTVHELISMGRCSEMDIVLDLWIHAIYNDAQIQGSDIGPVVYFRNSTKIRSLAIRSFPHVGGSPKLLCPGFWINCRKWNTCHWYPSPAGTAASSTCAVIYLPCLQSVT